MRFQLAPVLIGFILGPLIEEHFKRAMLYARGDFVEVMQRPLAGVILALSALMVAWAVYRSIRPKAAPAEV
jgi:TctA family transporter